MAVTEVLRNVQTARNMLFSQWIQSGQNDPLPPERSAEDWDRLRKTAPVWLSPRIIAGFDPDQFGFLSDENRTVLAEAVNGFRKVAEAVIDREPAENEVNRGIRYLITIIGLLDERILEPEGRALLAAIRRSTKRFPDFVLGLDYTLDTDATGDPGIWIWVIVPDDVDPDSAEFRRFTEWFPKAVRDALAQIKSERLPYIHYRPISEAVEAMSEGVA